MRRLVVILVAVVAIMVFMFTRSSNMDAMVRSSNNSKDTPVIITEEVDPNLHSATFAGGCFWCTEAYFQETDGVKNVISGYAGGEEYNPTYKDVYSELTGHREAVRVYFEPQEISFEELVDIFWKSIDPTDSGGQFIDRGLSYTTAIFYEDEAQKTIAESTKAELDKTGRFDEPIVTAILPFTTFYQAEDYHQDFYKKSTERYKNYSENSGREEFKAQVWSEIQQENL